MPKTHAGARTRMTIGTLNQIKNSEIVPGNWRDFIGPRTKCGCDSIMRIRGIVLLWETVDMQFREFTRITSRTQCASSRRTPRPENQVVLDGQLPIILLPFMEHEGRALYFDVLSGCDRRSRRGEVLSTVDSRQFDRRQLSRRADRRYPALNIISGCRSCCLGSKKSCNNLNRLKKFYKTLPSGNVLVHT
jgi:hypothetical protein